MKRICVFCGSSHGRRDAFARAAEGFADILVRRGIELVYGGAKLGLMGVLANRVLNEGGRVTGVIPEVLMKKEVVHDGLSDLLVVSSMHERKAKMAELADAFVSLPGGLGTWEETFEMLTWGQLRIHDKPVGLLDVEDYFAPIVELFDHGRSEGFVRGMHHGLLLVETDPERLLDKMEAYEPPSGKKWLSPEQS